MIRIFMCGCCGRMGRAINEMSKQYDDLKIVAGCDIAEDHSGLDFPVFKNPTDCDVEFDTIIDFSHASLLGSLVELAKRTNTSLICCTTGLSEDDIALLNETSKIIPVFRSANMSFGMNVLIKLVKQATKALYPGYDIEIVEAHHNKKLDAPSGTAIMIADEINNETGNQLEYVYDRHQVRQKRDTHELGISSIRGGNIVGEHEVMFIGDEEIIKISHSANTRFVFGRGALNAAKFIVGKKPGMYDMSDVLDEVLGNNI